RHRRPADQVAFQLHIYLDGRIAAAVQNLTRMDTLDGGSHMRIGKRKAGKGKSATGLFGRPVLIADHRRDKPYPICDNLLSCVSSSPRVSQRCPQGECPMPELPTGKHHASAEPITSQPNVDPGVTKDDSLGSSGSWHSNFAPGAAHRFTIEKLH